MVKLLEITCSVAGEGEAQDTLAGLRVIPGFVFGYARASKSSAPDTIDQVVALHQVAECAINGRTLPGQRVALVPESMVAALTPAGATTGTRQGGGEAIAPGIQFRDNGGHLMKTVRPHGAGDWWCKGVLEDIGEWLYSEGCIRRGLVAVKEN